MKKVLIADKADAVCEKVLREKGVTAIKKPLRMPQN